MHLRRLRRHPTARWALALTLALATAVTVSASLRAADDARRAWGTTRTVAVATRDLPAGAVLAAGDVALRAWPAALVPAGAVEGAPVGREARAAIAAGEVVVGERLAPAGAGGAGGLVPPGWRVVAIAIGPATLPVATGDVVDLYATADPTAGFGGAPAALVAEGAVVVGTTGDAVSVAVPASRVADLAAASASGSVTLAGRP